MHAVANRVHIDAAARVRGALAELDRTREARALGIAPTDAALAAAVAAEGWIESFLRQGRQADDPRRSVAALIDLADTLGEPDGHQ